MKAIEVLAIIAIGCCGWAFGGALLGSDASPSLGLFVAMVIVTTVSAFAYVTYVNAHASSAREKLLPVFLRLLLSVAGLVCLYFFGRLLVWFFFYSESDSTSGNAQLEVLTCAIGALSLISLWLYGLRIFKIVQQRQGRA